MVACFLNSVNGAVGSALAGAGRMWTGMAMNLGWACALTIAAWLLIPSEKGLGLATAYLLAYLLHTVWVMLYVEAKLVPKLVSRNRLLIAFSLTVLSLSVYQAVSEINNYALSFSLACISGVPLLLYIKRKRQLFEVGGVDYIGPSSK
jgi:O-antigen/teichoic acid export membrane protein